MDFRKKQNLLIIVAIIIIVLGFSISNYINKQKIYILSHNNNEKSVSDPIPHIQDTIYDANNVTNNEINKEKIIIHVEGEVNSPGVYELDKEARVFDAIKAAGGLLETADRKKINLAKKIVDEEFVYIPSENDFNEVVENQVGTYSIDKTGSLININKADVTELKTLSGIGEVLANRIIEYRKEKGGFNSIEELKNVSGIGEKKFNEIKDKITIK